MNFVKLVPNVFYANINDALRLFIDCLQFSIEHDELKSEKPFCVIEKNSLRINLFENEALAKEHSREFRLVTNDIDKVYRNWSSSYPHFLHSHLKEVTLRSWGANEFAFMD